MNVRAASGLWRTGVYQFASIVKDSGHWALLLLWQLRFSWVLKWPFVNDCVWLLDSKKVHISVTFANWTRTGQRIKRHVLQGWNIIVSFGLPMCTRIQTHLLHEGLVNATDHFMRGVSISVAGFRGWICTYRGHQESFLKLVERIYLLFASFNQTVGTMFSLVCLVAFGGSRMVLLPGTEGTRMHCCDLFYLDIVIADKLLAWLGTNRVGRDRLSRLFVDRVVKKLVGFSTSILGIKLVNCRKFTIGCHLDYSRILIWCVQSCDWTTLIDFDVDDFAVHSRPHLQTVGRWVFFSGSYNCEICHGD